MSVTRKRVTEAIAKKKSHHAVTEAASLFPEHMVIKNLEPSSRVKVAAELKPGAKVLGFE